MLASLHPNSPTPDKAVKDLIDQRARASHTRYPSVSYSQRSDSPSIYSRLELSPNTQPQSRGGWLTPGDDMSLMSQGQSGLDEYSDSDDEVDSLTTFTRCSIERDNDSVFPPADDDVSVISIPTPKPLGQLVRQPPVTHDLNTEAESPPTEEPEEDSRMSMLGPKMRFVSKAPWELGDEDLLEEEEEEPGSTTDALAMFSNKMSNWRSRDQDKSSIKGLGLTTLRSRSPGSPSSSNRKGGMFRNQNHENQREGPYGPHLSGASQSHGAIPSSLVSSSKFSHSVTDSLSSDHVFHRHGHAKMPPAAESSLLPAHLFRSQNTSRSSHDESDSSRSDSSPPSSRFVHPYANPELLSRPAYEPPAAQINQTPGTSQDRLSEERQGSPTRRASESATTSPPQMASLRKPSAGGTPLPALPSRTATGEYVDNNDIPPINARPRAHTSSRPTTSSSVRMVPFGDQQGSPMHNLITLEQARARVQSAPNRGQGSSNGSILTPKSTPSSTLVAGLGLAPGVVVDSGVIRSQRPTTPSVPLPDPSSGPTIPEQKANPFSRPRTMSTGKHVFGNGIGAGADGDVVPAKTIKHKKSGFMKLFQGKDKEREKESASPAPDYPVRAMSTPPQLHPSRDSPVPPLPNLHNIKRVPPPLPLSVFVTSPSFPPTALPSQSREGTPKNTASPPRTRQASAPVQTSNNPSTTTRGDGPHDSSSLGSELSRPTASAPPSQTTFEALSLRPMSTMFSAKFPDMLCASPLLENNASSSSTTPKRLDDPTPPTPGFSSSRSNSVSTSSDYPVTPNSLPGPPSLGLMPGEDQSSLIASLQEQIVNSRKMWQRQIWELEGQVRDLKTEVEELRNTGDCDVCGMAKRERLRTPVPQNSSVVDRPRPRLGGGNTRSVFGGGTDM